MCKQWASSLVLLRLFWMVHEVRALAYRIVTYRAEHFQAVACPVARQHSMSQMTYLRRFGLGSLSLGSSAGAFFSSVVGCWSTPPPSTASPKVSFTSASNFL